MKNGAGSILVNNIGNDISSRISDLSEKDWRLSQEIILNVPFLTVKRCLMVMRQQRYGRIITLGAAESAAIPGRMRPLMKLVVNKY